VAHVCLQDQFCNGLKFAADFVQEVIHKDCNSPITRSSDLVMQVEIKTVFRAELFPVFKFNYQISIVPSQRQQFLQRLLVSSAIAHLTGVIG
jgi:hypothetical protein